MKKSFVLLFCLFCVSLFGEVLEREGNGYLELEQQQLILHLKGTPYEMGFQHGKLLKDKIKKNIGSIVDVGLNNERGKTRLEEFKKALPQMMKFISQDIIDELHGLADGSEIPYDKILLVNLFPELFHCTGIIAKGEATQDRNLYHVRVLDYILAKNLQSTAVLMVVEPTGKHAFLNVGYAGFVGSVTGMNHEKISVGEIGGLGYGYWEGVPMAFLIREILEKASTFEQAEEILRTSARTCEYFYLIADGKSQKSAGVYATASQIHFIAPGDSYALMAPYGLPDNYGKDGRNDKFFLSPYVMENSAYQTVVYKDKAKKDSDIVALFHQQPPECVVMTGFVKPARYVVLMDRLMGKFGKIGVTDLQEMIRKPVTCETNLHNAIFAPATLEVWISHAGPNGEAASEQAYFHYQME